MELCGKYETVREIIKVVF